MKVKIPEGVIEKYKDHELRDCIYYYCDLIRRKKKQQELEKEARFVLEERYDKVIELLLKDKVIVKI